MSILRLTKANCKNCYKCIRHCPVKAIEVVRDQAQIIEKECILCGRCVQVCPQNAKHVRNDVGKVKALIEAGKPVIASLAPAFIANYGVSGVEDMKCYLKKLGFFDVMETAVGANIVKKEYERLIQERYQSVIISSCCSTVVKLIQKYYPSVIKNIAPILSPMQTHAKLIKEQSPEASVVFIGPCYSKKEEAMEYGKTVDVVLTFEELDEWLKEKSIEIEKKEVLDETHYLSRFFPTTGGILKTMKRTPEYRYLTIDSMSGCVSALKDIESGILKNCFIEMSACKGSCINGPSIKKDSHSILSSEVRIDDFAYTPLKQDYDVTVAFDLSKQIKDNYVEIVEPSSREIDKILKKMGKKTIDDQLNCGFCGYSTCIDKAVAVFFGKADITMCLPYMKQKAESFSDTIVNATPNAILSVDSSLNVVQMNFAAAALFNITNIDGVKGTAISNYMDEFDFVNVVATEKSVNDQKIYLVEYDKVVEQSIVYNADNNMMICIMKDITEKENETDRLKKTKQSAADLTDKVIEKQMRVVQEIASLLGETTAETKIALTKLKNTVLMDD